MDNVAWLSAWILVLGVTTASAQGTAPDRPPADGARPTTVPAVPASPDAAPSAPVSPSPRWPRSALERPLTLPEGMFSAGLDVQTFTRAVFDPAYLRLPLAYGVNDDLELAAGYAFATDGVHKGKIGVGLGYTLVRGGTREAIGRASIGYDLAGSRDLVTNETSGAVSPLGIGVELRLVLANVLALYSPREQLRIGLDSIYIDLSLPLGVGVQVMPALFSFVETNLATIDIKGSATTVIFSDATPIFAGARYTAMRALDVGIGVSADLTPPDGAGIGDTLSVLAGARYYGGL